MRKNIVFFLLLLFNAMAACSYALGGSKIVVANRNQSSLSVISTLTNKVINTVSLPNAEPMYVVHVPRVHRIFVGDRANDRVFVLDDKTIKLVDTVAVGRGVFHMWANLIGTQLWVVGDIDNTLSVIDPQSLKVTSVPIPNDIAMQGGRPHDVVLDEWPYPTSAYVSFVGLSGEQDYVVKFNTKTFKEVARVALDKDPHLALNLVSNTLFVASQQGNALYVLNRETMRTVARIAINGAHGVSLFPLGKSLYVTDITAANGTGALYQYDILTKSLIGLPIDTGFGISHNAAQDLLGTQLYVTHSGASSNKLTYYRLNPLTGAPTRAGEIEVGLNPFGLAFVL